MRCCISFFLLCATLGADSPSPGRKYTTLERLETEHLAAVHEARLKLAAVRKSVPRSGHFIDFRAVIHVHAEDAPHTKGTRVEVLTAAKATGVSIVMWTDHRGPNPATWSGIREGVLFIPGSEDDHLLRFPKPGAELRFLSHLEETPHASGSGFQGMEIYNRHTDAKDEKAFDEYFRAAMKNPEEWAKLAAKDAKYPEEVFGAGVDYWPSIMAMWDKELRTHLFTGIAANDSHKNQTYNGVTFDPYEVSFRNVSTHILARELSDDAVRVRLRRLSIVLAVRRRPRTRRRRYKSINEATVIREAAASLASPSSPIRSRPPRAALVSSLALSRACSRPTSLVRPSERRRILPVPRMR